jgi:hypothetical protein
MSSRVRLTRGSTLFSTVAPDPLTDIFVPLLLNQRFAVLDG